MRPMRRTPATRRDPAPSRWAYRFQRWWLTPAFRQVVRVGFPVTAALLGTGFYLTDVERQRAIGDAMSDLRRSVEERPEFMVKVLSVGGASDLLAQDVRDTLSIDLPQSSFDLDLEAMRKDVESLDAVRRAEVRVRSGGILQVRIEERVPVVVWRGPQGLELLDAEGHRVTETDSRSSHPTLPLIAGDGAPDHVPEALALIDRTGPVREQVVGFVRMSEYRWDLVLETGQRVLLPEEGAAAALDRVLALNEAQDLLERDVTHVDMRNADRPTVRMSPHAVLALKELKEVFVKKDATE